MDKSGSCSFASLHNHLQGAALRAAGVVVNAQDLVLMNAKCVREINKIRGDATLPIKDGHHACHTVSLLNRRFQRATFQGRAEGETIQEKESGGSSRRFGSAERGQHRRLHVTAKSSGL